MSNLFSKNDINNTLTHLNRSFYKFINTDTKSDITDFISNMTCWIKLRKISVKEKHFQWIERKIIIFIPYAL